LTPGGDDTPGKDASKVTSTAVAVAGGVGLVAAGLLIYFLAAKRKKKDNENE